ncbi:hypothetical protein [Pseudolactococcus insecticola]|uniref:Uncharacterized protein n=1 Tax=Pseudolactococcus insecticola TaxID=2709158 RepID=A0A6A0B7L8_9LACT|nr:hypothetical protein [Lactococcus insecticola]GFH41282.1 hypothetical protein Hs20B_16800 [Lactococcus insecticola]
MKKRFSGSVSDSKFRPLVAVSGSTKAVAYALGGAAVVVGAAVATLTVDTPTAAADTTITYDGLGNTYNLPDQQTAYNAALARFQTAQSEVNSLNAQVADLQAQYQAIIDKAIAGGLTPSYSGDDVSSSDKGVITIGASDTMDTSVTYQEAQAKLDQWQAQMTKALADVTAAINQIKQADSSQEDYAALQALVIDYNNKITADANKLNVEAGSMVATYNPSTTVSVSTAAEALAKFNEIDAQLAAQLQTQLNNAVDVTQETISQINMGISMNAKTTATGLSQTYGDLTVTVTANESSKTITLTDANGDGSYQDDLQKFLDSENASIAAQKAAIQAKIADKSANANALDGIYDVISNDLTNKQQVNQSQNDKIVLDAADVLETAKSTVEQTNALVAEASKKDDVVNNINSIIEKISKKDTDYTPYDQAPLEVSKIDATTIIANSDDSDPQNDALYDLSGDTLAEAQATLDKITAIVANQSSTIAENQAAIDTAYAEVERLKKQLADYQTAYAAYQVAFAKYVKDAAAYAKFYGYAFDADGNETQTGSGTGSGGATADGVTKVADVLGEPTYTVNSASKDTVSAAVSQIIQDTDLNMDQFDGITKTTDFSNIASTATFSSAFYRGTGAGDIEKMLTNTLTGAGGTVWQAEPGFANNVAAQEALAGYRAAEDSDDNIKSPDLVLRTIISASTIINAANAGITNIDVGSVTFPNAIVYTDKDGNIQRADFTTELYVTVPQQTAEYMAMASNYITPALVVQYSIKSYDTDSTTSGEEGLGISVWAMIATDTMVGSDGTTGTTISGSVNVDGNSAGNVSSTGTGKAVGSAGGLLSTLSTSGGLMPGTYGVGGIFSNDQVIAIAVNPIEGLPIIWGSNKNVLIAQSYSDIDAGQSVKLSDGRTYGLVFMDGAGYQSSVPGVPNTDNQIYFTTKVSNNSGTSISNTGFLQLTNTSSPQNSIWYDFIANDTISGQVASIQAGFFGQAYTLAPPMPVLPPELPDVTAAKIELEKFEKFIANIGSADQANYSITYDTATIPTPDTLQTTYTLLTPTNEIEKPPVVTVNPVMAQFSTTPVFTSNIPDIEDFGTVAINVDIKKNLKPLKTVVVEDAGSQALELSIKTTLKPLDRVVTNDYGGQAIQVSKSITLKPLTPLVTDDLGSQALEISKTINLKPVATQAVMDAGSQALSIIEKTNLKPLPVLAAPVTSDSKTSTTSTSTTPTSITDNKTTTSVTLSSNATVSDIVNAVLTKIGEKAIQEANFDKLTDYVKTAITKVPDGVTNVPQYILDNLTLKVTTVDDKTQTIALSMVYPAVATPVSTSTSTPVTATMAAPVKLDLLTNVIIMASNPAKYTGNVSNSLPFIQAEAAVNNAITKTVTNDLTRQSQIDIFNAVYDLVSKGTPVSDVTIVRLSNGTVSVNVTDKPVVSIPVKVGD